MGEDSDQDSWMETSYDDTLQHCIIRELEENATDSPKFQTLSHEANERNRREGQRVLLERECCSFSLLSFLLHSVRQLWLGRSITSLGIQES